MRFTNARDHNESAIVAALEQIGVMVVRISSPGVPDLIAYRPDVGVRLIEVKSARGRSTRAQRALTIPYATVRSVDEALALFGVKWSVSS